MFLLNIVFHSMLLFLDNILMLISNQQFNKNNTKNNRDKQIARRMMLITFIAAIFGWQIFGTHYIVILIAYFGFILSNTKKNLQSIEAIAVTILTMAILALVFIPSIYQQWLFILNIAGLAFFIREVLFSAKNLDEKQLFHPNTQTQAGKTHIAASLLMLTIICVLLIAPQNILLQQIITYTLTAHSLTSYISKVARHNKNKASTKPRTYQNLDKQNIALVITTILIASISIYAKVSGDATLLISTWLFSSSFLINFIIATCAITAIVGIINMVPTNESYIKANPEPIVMRPPTVHTLQPGTPQITTAVREKQHKWGGGAPRPT